MPGARGSAGSSGRGGAGDAPAAPPAPLPLNRIVCGEAAAVMRGLPDSSVDLVVTSPPYYRQRSYGGAGGTGQEGSLGAYIDAVMEVFRECVRTTKDAGSIVFNLGDKRVGESLLLAPHRFAIRAMDETGVRLVSEMTWLKSNPTPRQFQGRPVPSTEPFFHFAKTGGYYYDAAEHEKSPPAERRVSKDGAAMGRHYEHLIASSGLSAPEKEGALEALHAVVAEVRAGKAAGFRMKIRGVHAPAFGGQAGGRQSQMENRGFTIIRLTGRPIRRDVLESPVESLKWSGHPAVYPEQIAAHFVRTLSPPGAAVLDPYAGSGTTCAAAKKAGRSYIGIDINPEYCAAAERRLAGIL